MLVAYVSRVTYTNNPLLPYKKAVFLIFQMLFLRDKNETFKNLNKMKI